MLRLLTVAMLALGLPQVPANSALIVGRVLDQTDGKPVSGAVVEISSLAVVNGAKSVTDNPTRRQMTDGLGRFVFREMPGDVYTVRVTVGGTGYSPSGYIQNGMGFRIGQYLDGGYGQARPGGQLQPLVVAEGQSIPDLVVRLWRGAALNGTVIDDLGEPVVDTVVGAVQVSSDGRLIDGPTVRTDDRGRYRLSALQPGAYIVFVPQTSTAMSADAAESAKQRIAELAAAKTPGAVAPAVPQLTGIRVGNALVNTQSTGLINGNLAPQRQGDNVFVFQTTFAPGATTLDGAAHIALAAGEDREGVDVSVRPVRATSVSGTVFVDGAPASGVRVHLSPLGTTLDASMFETAVAQTDAQGRFTLPVVPEGNYVATAMNSPLAARPPASPIEHSVLDAGGPGAWFSEQIGVGPDEVKGLVFTMKRGYSVRGQIEFAPGTPRPPADALVKIMLGLRSVQPRARADQAGGGAQAYVDADGAFQLIGVPPGRYVLRLLTSPPGVPLRTQSVTFGGREFVELPIEISDDVNNVQVTLGPTLGSVAGRVASVEPGDGAMAVLLFPADRALWPDARGLAARFRLARTSVGGDFAIANVPPGNYLTIALPDADTARWPDVSFVTTLLTEATALRVDPGQNQTVSLVAKVIR